MFSSTWSKAIVFVCVVGVRVYMCTLLVTVETNKKVWIGETFTQWRREEELTLNKEVANENEGILKKSKNWAGNITV